MFKFFMIFILILVIMTIIGLIIQSIEKRNERKKHIQERQQMYQKREELKEKINKEVEKNKEELFALKKRQPYRKFNISGVTYENRQGLLRSILEFYGDEGVGRIELIPEPGNDYDPHAIRIDFIGKGTVGYVPVDRSEEIGHLISKKNYKIKWNIDTFYDEEDDRIYYMEIRLYS